MPAKNKYCALTDHFLVFLIFSFSSGLISVMLSTSRSKTKRNGLPIDPKVFATSTIDAHATQIDETRSNQDKGTKKVPKACERASPRASLRNVIVNAKIALASVIICLSASTPISFAFSIGLSGGGFMIPKTLFHSVPLVQLSLHLLNLLRGRQKILFAIVPFLNGCEVVPK